MCESIAVAGIGCDVNTKLGTVHTTSFCSVVSVCGSKERPFHMKLFLRFLVCLCLMLSKIDDLSALALGWKGCSDMYQIVVTRPSTNKQGRRLVSLEVSR